MRKLIIKVLPMVDLLLAPLIYLSAWTMKFVRRARIQRFPMCRKILFAVGVFPILDHYYEPQFNHSGLKRSLSANRDLPGIDWNMNGQLELLKELVFSEELRNLPRKATEKTEFHLDNGAFGAGDAEYWYQIIRAKKPRKIIEIGSGYSTLMAIRAINKNKECDPTYTCEHTCVEPYEMPWLESSGVAVIRERVEDLDPSIFASLQENDVLFIDSSHIIRPQGDVLFEYLELLPSLQKGVIVHIHDIFSPKDYPKKWVQEEIRLWNEQYILEAFLTHNNSWKIIGSLNKLHKEHYAEFSKVAPFSPPRTGSGSFYIQKVA